MNKAVHFFDTKPYTEEFFTQANADPAFGYTLKYLPSRLTPDTVSLAEGREVICVFVNDDLREVAMIDALHAHGVRLIALRCAGYNNINLQACRDRIRVVRVPAYSPHAVAEHALAMMLTLNRKTHKAYSRTREGNFAIQGLMGFDMYEKVAGVVGTGTIGRVMAEMLCGLGMRVLLHDPYPDTAWSEGHGMYYVDLETLYREAHVITLHCPLTPDNKHMIRRGTLQQMRDGVMIINTGRGGLIHAADLIEALKERKVGAAGLDVYEEEDQYFFEDLSSEVMSDDVLARLLTFPNVLVTAHQAFFTREAMTNITLTTLNNIRAYFAGEALVNEVCARCQ